MKLEAREKQVREHAKRLANRFSTRYGYSTMEETLCDMGRWCDANQPSPWVNVKEHLPKKARGLYDLEKDEQDKLLFVKTVKGKYHVAFLDAEEIFRRLSTAVPFDFEEVVAWMYIPR